MSIVDQIQSGAVAVSDRTRVFGYSAGVPNMCIDAKKSNLKCNPIDGGVLLPFFPGRDGYKGGMTTNGTFQQMYLDIMPSEYAYRVEQMFHTNKDFGYRTLTPLTALDHELPPARPRMPRIVDPITRRQDSYELAQWNKTIADYDKTYNDDWYREHDLAYAYFNTVHPTISTCDYGLNQKIQLGEAGGVPGELFYQHCPTCRLAHLQSDACSEAIYNASTELDSKVLLQLRELLISANQSALNFVSALSAEVMGDISRRMTGSDNGRANLNSIDRIHLKMMHKTENAQNNTQVDMIRGLAQEMATAFRATAPAAVAEPVNQLSPEELAEYRELKAKQDAAKDRMAKAREAKGKEALNGSSTNGLETEK